MTPAEERDLDELIEALAALLLAEAERGESEVEGQAEPEAA